MYLIAEYLLKVIDFTAALPPIPLLNGQTPIGNTACVTGLSHLFAWETLWLSGGDKRKQSLARNGPSLLARTTGSPAGAATATAATTAGGSDCAQPEEDYED
jgi:hypothetical protein